MNPISGKTFSHTRAAPRPGEKKGFFQVALKISSLVSKGRKGKSFFGKSKAD